MAFQLQELNLDNKLTEDKVVESVRELFSKMTEIFIELAKVDVEIDFNN